MTNVPSGVNTEQAIRRLQRAEFTLYRRGEVAFTLESRRQGQVRKVKQATFKEEIMTDDTVKVTLVSTIPLDFRLRDYIVYDGRPYFLNKLPQAAVGNGKRYTYTMVFEGAMFELGRVAFVLPDANGYDYYGTLPEFGRLVVDNMNRVNMWVEWNYTYQGNTTRHAGRYRGKVEVTHGSGNNQVTKILYKWGAGFNHDLEGMGERFIYTDGMPTANAHAIDPEDFSSVSYVTITAVRTWSLSFPKQKTHPTEYPTPAAHIPDSIYAYSWAEPTHETDNETMARINALASSLSWDETEGSIERGLRVTYVDNSVSYGDIPAPVPSVPSKAEDVCVVNQEVTFRLQFLSWWDDNQYGTSGSTEYYETRTIEREVRYTADVDETGWIVTPIAPPSGSSTSEDYPTESILLSYDCHSCLAVMQDLCLQWEGWEWKVGGVSFAFINGQMCVCGTITMEQNSNMSSSYPTHAMSYGRSGGIGNLSRKYADDGNIPSRIYFYGGTQNLPQYYRNTRLCLPEMDKAESYIDVGQYQGVSFTEGIDNAVCEQIVCFDDIYPANKPFEIKPTWTVEVATPQGRTIPYLIMYIPPADFFDLNGKWKSFDEMQSPYPDYLEWLTWKNYGDSEESRLQYTDYYVGVSKYRIAGETPMFTFQTGEIGGYSLSVHEFYFDDKTQKYLVMLNVVKEPNEEVDDDYHVPNEEICCRQGDKFIVENIYMPVRYTYYQDGTDSDFSAENQLWRASVEYVMNLMSKFDYEIEVSKDFIETMQNEFRCFDIVQFTDISGNMVKRRILSVERDLVDEYKQKITLTNRGLVRPWKAIGRLIANNIKAL